jgi:hypothetical protein
MKILEDSSGELSKANLEPCPPTVKGFTIFLGDAKDEAEINKTVPEQPLHEQGPFESLLPEIEDI